MKLRNKNLAGVLWLGRLLKRRDMNAKAVYLNIGLTISTKQTSISPATVTLITILEVNQSTDHTLESTKNITLTENTTADPSIPHDDNVTPIQLTSDTAESRRKPQSRKLKKTDK
ncbi:hypothetical protein RclHR1_07840008 [Rhizophagus clarus]|uniref:Uncharacterized protein n=1 Tax=Rhizophagus clarus TaxID=94130 RepID=A0A2Z6SA28_9GLOM|nr:hypothetical protein RclHR1_07840008 [Rhizophagus clarus]